ncbi:hypothetical protein ACSTLD_23955, partial [Vibrio parahaemolyticus]
ALSHTLTALDVMRQSAVPLRAIILSESAEPSAPLTDIAAELARFTDVPIIQVARGGGDIHALESLL